MKLALLVIHHNPPANSGDNTARALLATNVSVTKSGAPGTYRASFPQPVGGRLPTNRQLRASSRQSPPGRKHPEARRIQKYFRCVTDSPARYRMNRREALSASKPRTRRRRSMFNVKSERRKTSMKIKTNVKAGSPTLPLPPPGRRP
jgi:hypothetical protein